MTKIILETSVANEVPNLSVFQENLYNCPLVFFVHGYGADREQAIDFGYCLQKKAFIT
ncbi:hypothetical protein [Virgibacillus sp. Bac330]|uniref:hypothetical protein n=1 Tax=Virgibacillus sp. Bac330 TaxID=2419841 RepID=UPI001F09873A|nr:hypothetical protein [Virgibacillus sp. Bac330]